MKAKRIIGAAAIIAAAVAAGFAVAKFFGPELMRAIARMHGAI